MPAYVQSPFKPTPQLLIPGKSEYVLGSFNDRTTPTFGTVITDAGATTTGTLVFQILAGNVPVVGALITVRGTANGSGHFNVTNAVILTVSNVDATGVCTVTYAIASTNQSATADSGEVEVPQPEVGEALVDGASVPVCEAFNSGIVNQGRTVTATVTFPSAPTSGTVYLQGAMFDINAQYQNIGIVVSVGSPTLLGPSADFPDLAFKFYRLFVTGSGGGTNPTICGKIS